MQIEKQANHATFCKEVKLVAGSTVARNVMPPAQVDTVDFLNLVVRFVNDIALQNCILNPAFG